VNESWGRRSREGVLLIVGVRMLIVSTANWVVTGTPPDKVIVGAALAVLGIIPVIQQGAEK
jgi:predicted tellurium resistance membrane protein TerC